MHDIVYLRVSIDGVVDVLRAIFWARKIRHVWQQADERRASTGEGDVHNDAQSGSGQLVPPPYPREATRDCGTHPMAYPSPSR